MNNGEKLQRERLDSSRKGITSVALKIFSLHVKSNASFFPKATLIWFDPERMATAMSTNVVLSLHFIFIMHLEWPSKKEWHWPSKTTILTWDGTLKTFACTKCFQCLIAWNDYCLREYSKNDLQNKIFCSNSHFVLLLHWSFEIKSLCLFIYLHIFSYICKVINEKRKVTLEVVAWGKQSFFFSFTWDCITTILYPKDKVFIDEI